MMVSVMLSRLQKPSHVSIILPLLVVLHLGFSHAGHLSPAFGDSETTEPEISHVQPSTHEYHSHHSASDPSISDERCPVPTVTVRFDDLDFEAIDLASQAQFDVYQVGEQTHRELREVLPKRKTGPTRHAILQCFRL
jgi:hypothetical protein